MNNLLTNLTGLVTPDFVTAGIISVSAFFSGVFSGVFLGAKMENTYQKNRKESRRKQREDFLKQISEQQGMDKERFINNDVPAIHRRQPETMRTKPESKTEISFESEPETGFAFLTTRMIQTEKSEKSDQGNKVVPLTKKQFIDLAA